MIKFSIVTHPFSGGVFDIFSGGMFDIVYTDRDENYAAHPVYLVRVYRDAIRLHTSADQAERNRLHAPSGLVFDEDGRIVVAE